MIASGQPDPGPTNAPLTDEKINVQEQWMLSAFERGGKWWDLEDSLGLIAALREARRERDTVNDHHAETMNELAQILEARDDDIAIDEIVADAARERMAERDAAIRERDGLRERLREWRSEWEVAVKERDVLRQRVGALEGFLGRLITGEHGYVGPIATERTETLLAASREHAGADAKT